MEAQATSWFNISLLTEKKTFFQLLTKAARDIASTENQMENSEENLKKMQLISVHIGYQFENIQKSAQLLTEISEQVMNMQRWCLRGKLVKRLNTMAYRKKKEIVDPFLNPVLFKLCVWYICLFIMVNFFFS